jgi:hypothetical protein
MKRLLAALALAGATIVAAPGMAHAESSCPTDVSAEEQVVCLRAENAQQAEHIDILRAAAQGYAATIFELSDQAEAAGLQLTQERNLRFATEYALAQERQAHAATQTKLDAANLRVVALRVKVKELRQIIRG